MALQVFPEVETLKPGLKARDAQLVTWKGTETGELAPSALSIAPVIAFGLQFVGLNVNPPGRLIVTLTCLICSGMPSMIVGIACGNRADPS